MRGEVPLQHLIKDCVVWARGAACRPRCVVPRPGAKRLAWATAQSLPARPRCRHARDLARWRSRGPHRANLGQGPHHRHYGGSDCALTTAPQCGGWLELVRADVTHALPAPRTRRTSPKPDGFQPPIPDAAVLEPEVAQHDPHHALFGGPDRMTGDTHGRRACWALAASRWPVRRRATTPRRRQLSFGQRQNFSWTYKRKDLAGRPRFVTAMRWGTSRLQGRTAPLTRASDDTKRNDEQKAAPLTEDVRLRRPPSGVRVEVVSAVGQSERANWW